MTRAEAKDLFRSDRNSYGAVKKPMTKINQIYDEHDAELALLWQFMESQRQVVLNQDNNIHGTLAVFWNEVRSRWVNSLADAMDELNKLINK